MMMWQPCQGLPHFFLRAVFFPLLYVASGVYMLGFFLVRCYKEIFGTKYRFNKKVVGIGNLVVGGTGKSVLAAYVSTLFKHGSCGIVLRGYGAFSSSKKRSFFVTKKSDVLCVGDEALMLAADTNVPVVVHTCKATALRALFSCTTVRIGIVDDAYQSFYLTTDVMVLLLDARAPFGNGYQLPAGPLREADLSRADIIVLTHANKVTDAQRAEGTTAVVRQGGMRDKIVYGRHTFAGIFAQNKKKIAINMLRNKRFYAVAGIGSPQQFFDMLGENGLIVHDHAAFPDHYHYSLSDIDAISLAAQGMPIVTTAKDWVKIEAALYRAARSGAGWYVARVSFAWCTPNDERHFCAQLKKCLGK